MKKKNIAIFASGTGSNALALIEQAKALPENIHIGLIFSDNPKAPLLDKILPLEIDTLVLNINDFSSKRKYETKILEELKQKEIDGIFLAGYMRIVSSYFLEKFQGNSYKIFNIHPSLLPNYPGLSAYHKAYQDHVKIHGATVHFVDEGMDTGPVVLQVQYMTNIDQSLDQFIDYGKTWEWKIYKHVLKMWALDHIQINKQGKRVLVECPPLRMES